MIALRPARSVLILANGALAEQSAARLRRDAVEIGLRLVRRAEALGRALRDPGGTARPDLIVVGLGPRPTGALALIRRLLADAPLRGVIVGACSTLGDLRARDLALTAGARFCVAGPLGRAQVSDICAAVPELVLVEDDTGFRLCRAVPGT